MSCYFFHHLLTARMNNSHRNIKNWPHICKILKSILLDNFKQKRMSHLHPVTTLVANLHPVTKLRPISSNDGNWKSKIALFGSFGGCLREKTLCLGASRSPVTYSSSWSGLFLDFRSVFRISRIYRSLSNFLRGKVGQLRTT